MTRVGLTVIACLCLLLSRGLNAQWSTDPTQNLIIGYGANPESCGDYAGGCYVTYENSIGYPTELVLERLNRYGYKAWTSPRFIAGELQDQRFVQIAEDGVGGALVAFSDDSIPPLGGTFRLRVQRIDSSGNFLWGQTGVRVSLSETNQGGHAIVPDGSGGCIVAWIDEADTIPPYDYHLRISKINSAGVWAWGDSGRFVWDYGHQTPSGSPPLVVDGQGGCILVFASRVQRFDSAGIPLWGPFGVQLDTLATAKIVPDGSGGVLLGGMKYISYNNGDPLWAAKAQRVNSGGQVLWGSNGLGLDDSLHGLFLNPPDIALERNIDGGGTFAWGKRIRPNVIRTFVQRVRANGTITFPDAGIQVSAVDSGGVGTWAIITSLEDSKILVSADARSNGSIVGQCIDSTGSRLWDTTDVPITIPGFSFIRAVPDGNGGVIVIGPRESFSIRAQQVSRYGNLGQVITSDNGGNIPSPIPILLLSQNYPNPFNAATTIRFQLPRRGNVQLVIHNLLGQRLVTLLDGIHEGGEGTVLFDAATLPSGVYLYRLETAYGSTTNKLIVLK
jgi:hypothetical protein